MKKMRLVKVVVFLTLSFITTLALAQDRIVPYSEIPAGIKSYVAKHFPKHNVIQSKIDMDGLSKQYEITLSDGIELTFNNKKQIIEIDGKSKLPDSVIPKKIRNFVAKNYPKNVITEWKIDGRRQQVGLDNDLDLEFKKNGDFIKIDN
jgi:hypothetical protein